MFLLNHQIYLIINQKFSNKGNMLKYIPKKINKILMWLINKEMNKKLIQVGGKLLILQFM